MENIQTMFTGSKSDSSIQNFYKNQTIFITGGTGFVGKVVIEKLLRSCQDLKKIYMLVRPKKGKSMQERFNELFNIACFERLKKLRNDFHEQVGLICGNCEEENLGISLEDREMLKREVTCVIHAAANVKFDQSLREAFNINVRATRDLVTLAKEMPKLKTFVYVSTFYANCIEKKIEERFYDPPMKASKLEYIIEFTNDDALEIMTPTLLGDYPNTYVYTKAVTEDVIKDAAETLPISIVRPAIIVTAYDEPMRGWIDNFYGIIGISAAASLGVLRSLHAKLDNYALLVPVDFVSNQVIAAGWKTATDKSKTTKIYNYVPPKNSCLTWRSYMWGIEEQAWNFATDKVLYYYCFKIRENALAHKTAIFFLHTVPAYIVDFFLFIAGRQTLAVANYKRLNKLLELLSYFSIRQWDFDNNNVHELYDCLSEQDKKLFNFDMRNIEWYEYGIESIVGGRVHLLKDPLETIPKGNRKIQILRIVHYTLMTVLTYTGIKLLMYLVNLICNLY